MNSVEILGIVATVIVLISMAFKTTSYKGTMCMRIINIIGSIAFTIYGFLLPAYATGIMNAILFFINIYYLIKETIDHKKKEPIN